MVYNINKNKSQGELFGNYINEKIIEIKNIEIKICNFILKNIRIK